MKIFYAILEGGKRVVQVATCAKNALFILAAKHAEEVENIREMSDDEFRDYAHGKDVDF